MQLALFLIFGVLCVAGALNFLFQRHPINSALSLVAVMMSLAVIYWTLGAEFLAAAQVIVYSGAIMVLFVFVVMLLNAGEETRTRGSSMAYVAGTRSAIWLVCDLVRQNKGDVRRTAALHAWPETKVRAAINYAEAYSGEIEPLIERAHNMTEETLRQLNAA